MAPIATSEAVLANACANGAQPTPMGFARSTSGVIGKGWESQPCAFPTSLPTVPSPIIWSRWVQRLCDVH